MGFWMMALLWATAVVLWDLLGPKPAIENAKPAGKGDFNFPTATEGRPVPMGWGTFIVEGPNTIWADDFRQDPIQETVKTGLFSKKKITVGFKYYWGWQQSLVQAGEYPVDEMLRVWIGDEEVFSGNVEHGDTFTIDEPELFGGDDLGSGGFVGTFEFFAGTRTQSASSYLSNFQKVPAVTGDTPEYHDVCYIAPLSEAAYVGNTTAIKPWKIELRRTPNPLALTANRHIVNGGDANPANVIYEALRMNEWGFGISAAEIDTANFVTAGNQLHAEGNGFSMLLDRAEDVGDFIKRLEDQIDGIVYLDPFDVKWKLALIRDDYDPDTIPEIDDDNIIEVSGFTRGTWEGTKNQVRIPFVDRLDDYKTTFGFAQDMANMRIVGKVTTTQVSHPGCAYPDLANALAWRELRTLAVPLASGEFILDRTAYGILPGHVLAYTCAEIGFTRVPMRVRSVDYGNLLEGQIRAFLVQDLFRASAGSFAPPPDTQWEPPSDELVAFDADEQVAFEAPRALTLRDPDSESPYTDKVFVAARRQGPEAAFKIVERHSAGTPVGAFTQIGAVYQFVRIGELLSTLPVGSAYPLSTLVLTSTPDSQSALETAFPDVTDLAELGNELLTLCMVGNEFFLVSSAQTTGANVQLNGVYRGVLDSVQEEHAAGDAVFLLFVGAGISDSTIPAGQNVHVKLLPKSLLGEVAEGDATQIEFAMENRTRRPYPPSELSINGTRFDPTVVLEGGAGSGEAIGIDLTFVRRDFRTVNEIAALLDDAAVLDPSYPSENSTTHEVDVINDPGGTPVLLFTQDLAALASGSITRLDILQATDGVLPTSLRFALRSVHDFEGDSFASRYDLVWDFALSSALTGQFEFGALDTNDVSAAFTVDDDSNDHDFTLSSAFSAGAVQYRINGGAFTTLIAAGGTTGTIPSASLNNGDTIEIRHQSSDVGAQKLITMDDGAPAAFGVLFV